MKAERAHWYRTAPTMTKSCSECNICELGVVLSLRSLKPNAAKNNGTEAADDFENGN